mmetsp:Transcript_16538/g.18702  ORF Transcript_16538/g.18702 Transcript_16538/m.18702 type:complete len:297 (+) Transcript_16538:271-1161(+)
MSQPTEIKAGGLFVDVDLEQNNNLPVLILALIVLGFWFSTNFLCPIPYSKFAAEEEIERKFHQRIFIQIFTYRLSPRLGWVICYAIPAVVPAVQFAILAKVNQDEIGKIAPSEDYALILFIMWELSFVKRTLEAAFLQVYSSTFPAISCIIITGGYTIFGCCAIHFANQVVGYGIGPDFDTFPIDIICMIGYVVFFLMNFYCHCKLANVRKNNKDKRYHSLEELGPLFQWLVCPHFVGEMLFWLFYAGLGGTFTHWIVAALANVTLSIRTYNNYYWYKEHDLIKKNDDRGLSSATL